MKARAGAALLELLTATVLLGILGAVCALLVHAQAVILRDTSDHVSADEALRTARVIVRSELRGLTPADVHAVGGDSVSARVVRGWAIVCAVSGGRVTLRYRGLREPDPEKDSLLVAGAERTGTFRSVTDPAARCPMRSDEQLFVIAPAIATHTGDVLLLFETGAYHIATNALRYRRGSEGRQPLTDEVIDDRASVFLLEPHARGLRLLLRARAGAFRGSSDTRFRFLNP